MGFLGREVPGLTRLASRVSEAFITGTSGLNLSPLGTPALNECGLAWTSEYLGFIPLEQNWEFYGLVRKGFMEEVPVQPRLQRWVGFQKAETRRGQLQGGPCPLSRGPSSGQGPPSARVARLNSSFSLKSHWCCPNRNLLFLGWLLGELLPTSPRPQNSPSQI